MRLVDADAAKALWSGDHPISFIMRKIFDGLPTVEAVPVIHARWAFRQSNGYAVCSHCCHEDRVDTTATHCRYCGAKMDLE